MAALAALTTLPGEVDRPVRVERLADADAGGAHAGHRAAAGRPGARADARRGPAHGRRPELGDELLAEARPHHAPRSGAARRRARVARRSSRGPRRRRQPLCGGRRARRQRRAGERRVRQGMRGVPQGRRRHAHRSRSRPVGHPASPAAGVAGGRAVAEPVHRAGVRDLRRRACQRAIRCRDAGGPDADDGHAAPGRPADPDFPRATSRRSRCCRNPRCPPISTRSSRPPRWRTCSRI